MFHHIIGTDLQLLLVIDMIRLRAQMARFKARTTAAGDAHNRSATHLPTNRFPQSRRYVPESP